MSKPAPAPVWLCRILGHKIEKFSCDKTFDYCVRCFTPTRGA